MRKYKGASDCAYVEAIEFLSPVSEGDRSRAYRQILERAVKSEGVYNIALSGPYGSGKSSILADFKKFAPQSIIEVSLANFQQHSKKNGEDGDEGGDVSLQTEIEKSILQQLFFSVSKKKIPYSRMKRISQPWPGQMVIYSLIVLILAVSGYILLHSELQKTYPVITGVAGWLAGAFFVALFAIFYRMASQFSRVKLNKLVIQNTEFDLAGESGETSLINKHIDELVYFFERNKYDIMIIEDLDRFGNVGIFEKLRELNTIVNRAASVRRKIVFIYAIRDDFLVGENRTKFFDLIVPVVPFVNASGNARHLIVRKLKEINMEEAVSSDLIKFISHYIHDYRLLANIFNEFLVYMCQIKRRNKVDSSGGEREGEHRELAPHDNSEVFALIFYKNIFPEDFSALHRGKGVLYSLLHQLRRNLIKNRVEEFDKKLEKIKNKIEDLRSSISEKMEEQRLLCLREIFTDYSDLHEIHWKGKRKTILEIAGNRELFDELLETISENRHTILLYTRRGNFQQSIGGGANIDECRKKVELLGEGRSTEISLLEADMDRIRREKKHIYGKNLADLVDEEKVREIIKQKIKTQLHENIDDENAEKMGEILSFLLEENFINDSYPVHISYFHEYEMLTPEERSYINNIIARKENDFSIRIIHPEAVLDEIPLGFLSTPSALNHDLVCFAFSDSPPSSNSRYKSIILRQLRNNKKLAELFIPSFVEYKSSEKCASNLLVELAEDNDLFWEDILTMAISNRELLLALLMSEASLDVLNRQGEPLKKSFFQFEHLPEFIRIYDLDIERLQVLIETWEGKFSRFVDFHGTEPEKRFLRIVFDNDAYELTFEMIALIVEYLGSMDKVELKEREWMVDYSTIAENAPAGLLARIEANMDEYVINVYIPHVLGSLNYFNYHSLLSILNHDNIDDTLIERIVENMNFKITDISEIENCTAAKAILTHARISPKWENVLPYFKECTDESVDEALSQLLKNRDFIQELFQSEMIEKTREEDGGVLDQFIEEILLSDSCEEWCLDIIETTSGPLEKILSSFESVEPAILERLIQKNLLAPKPDIFISLRDYSRPKGINIHILFLSINVELLLDRIDELDLKSEDVQQLLETEMSCKNKLAILEKVTDAELWKEISHQLEPLIRDCLEKKALSDIPNNVIEKFMEYSEMEKSLKMRLLAICSRTMEDADNMVAILKKAGPPYSMLVEDDGKTTVNFEITEDNRVILENCNRLGIIGTIREKSDNIHFIVYKRHL